MALDDTAVRKVAQWGNQVRMQVAKRYVGPSAHIDALMVALLSDGHVLIEGIPGIAKTTLVKTFAAAVGCGYRRVQFTPDLLPSDITGTHVWQAAQADFVLHEGPVFTQVLLADEINRAPAKTQSALLEAMQERQVTLEGITKALPRPFMVLATQNPIEHEGTYRLPEAQLDRFLLKLLLGYPNRADEERILDLYTSPLEPLQPAGGQDFVLTAMAWCREVHVSLEVRRYVLDLLDFTRKHRSSYLGASPRAGLHLLHAARAMALLRGRDHVLPDDIKSLCPSVLSHRIMLTPEAELDALDASSIVDEAIRTVPVLPVQGQA